MGSNHVVLQVVYVAQLTRHNFNLEGCDKFARLPIFVEYTSSIKSCSGFAADSWNPVLGVINIWISKLSDRFKAVKELCENLIAGTL